MYKPKGRTVSKTTRLDEELLDLLEKKAEKEYLSSSAMIDNVLTKYVNYYMYLESYPSITLSQSEFQSIIIEVDDEKIEAIGKRLGYTNPRNYFLMRGINPDISSVMSIIETHYGVGNKWFEVYNHHKDDEYLLHCTHRFGLKWSLFLDDYFRSMFQELLGSGVDISYTDSYITMKIKKNGKE